MPRLRFVLLTIPLVTCAAVVSARAQGPSTLPEPLPVVAGAKVVTLWPAGSPALAVPRSTGRDDGKPTDLREVFTMTTGQPDRVQKVVNVHNPSIELHLAPSSKANGTAIILAPGGGNTELGVGTEGTDIATWLNDLVFRRSTC